MVKDGRGDYQANLATIRGIAIKRPIIIGSIAQQLAKVRPRNRTHSWVVYVRGLKNEDLSYFIKCVVFQIHEDFPPPRRECFEAPFEVSEMGWGEFEVQIEIHFHGMEEIFQTSHFLKLHAEEGIDKNANAPVIREMFTEITIRDPSVDLYKRLYCGPARILPNHKYQRFWHVNDTADKEQESIKAIDGAHREVTEKLKHSLEQFNTMMMVIRNYHQQKKETLDKISKISQKRKPKPVPNNPKLAPHPNRQMVHNTNPPIPNRSMPPTTSRPPIPKNTGLLQRSIAHQQSRLNPVLPVGARPPSMQPAPPRPRLPQKEQSKPLWRFKS